MKSIKPIRKTTSTRIPVILFTGLLLIIGTTAGFALTSSDEQLVNQPIVSKKQKTQYTDSQEPTEQKPITNEVKAAANEKPAQKSSWPVEISMSEASSLQVVVNKKHKLPSTFAPNLVTVAGGQMRPNAASAMQTMINDASGAGASMIIVSSYRSYQTQVSTYQYWVDTQGKAQADRESARPGHSEHQTGLTADMGNPDGSCRLVACFGTGTAGQWLATNAHKYGFIIRYPSGKESLTGYIYEPWHVRYLGVDVATAIYNSGQTLDQYYGVEAGDY